MFSSDTDDIDDCIVYKKHDHSEISNKHDEVDNIESLSCSSNHSHGAVGNSQLVQRLALWFSDTQLAGSNPIGDGQGYELLEK